MQALTPRQAVLIPQGRSAGSASTPSQEGNKQPRNSAGNAGIHSQQTAPNSPLMPGRSAGSADTLAQADQSLSPSQGASALQWGMLLLPWTIQVSLGNKGRDLEGRYPSSLSHDKPNLYLLGVPPNQEENTIEDHSHKWIINLSSKPLTQAQRTFLAKDPIIP